MTSFSATYSPDDNKLRLYASTRLDPETYARVKAAGFAWAPKQDLFVAPMWTPEREDLLLELAGDVEDEDKSLVERAEERADRFEDYSEKRTADAHRAREAVAAIADNIPLGQPILVGHHSERRARKDAKRIQNGMDRAVKLWRTAGYWKGRAHGAIAAAKYKERPDVRARRIKTLEAERRKVERTKKEHQDALALWTKIQAINDPEKRLATARYATGHSQIGRLRIVKREGGSAYDYWTAYDVLRPSKEEAKEGEHARYDACPGYTVERVLEMALRAYDKPMARCDRWLEHIDGRLEYERAMLADAGGGAADRFDIQPGGRVRVRGEWVTVLRVNRAEGRITSVTTNSKYVAVRPIDEVSDYEPPTAESAAAVAERMKAKPICNYPVEGRPEITRAQWAEIPNDYKCTRVIAATETAGAHRVRHAMGVFLKRAGAQIPGMDDNKRHSLIAVYISDEKRKDAPGADLLPSPALPAPERTPRLPSTPRPEDADAAAFQALATAAKAGVKVVAVPQLFETPRWLASDVRDAANIQRGDRLLEPSAGTGRLLDALYNEDGTQWVLGDEGSAIAVEVNTELRRRLTAQYANICIQEGDFLAISSPQLGGPFDRVIMNPPFANGVDIKHIEHAAAMLKPGGRLVAICANGPRQQAALKPLATEWRDLPAGSFEESGTGVNVAMVVIDRAA